MSQTISTCTLRSQLKNENEFWRYGLGRYEIAKAGMIDTSLRGGEHFPCSSYLTVMIRYKKLPISIGVCAVAISETRSKSGKQFLPK